MKRRLRVLLACHLYVAATMREPSRGSVPSDPSRVSADVAASHRRTAFRAGVLLASATALAPSTSVAEPGDDGYCDYVEGAAAADAATLFMPQLFAQFGYVEQPSSEFTPSADSTNLRVLGGIRYSVTDIYAGLATKSHARADCERHRALTGLRDTTTARALAARIQVYEDAQAEASRILRDQETAVETRQSTAQDLLATRLRVEELRTLAASARRELAALPPVDGRPVRTLLSAYRSADADIERSEGRLRSIRAYDVTVRIGADRFLEGANQDTQFFGVLQLGVNVGALWTGAGNRRAANGRRRYARTESQVLDGTTFEQLRTALDVEQKLVEQSAALVGDLARQLEAVTQVTGEDGKRFHETLWFAWVKASADLAYQRAHIEALREVLAAEPR